MHEDHRWSFPESGTDSYFDLIHEFQLPRHLVRVKLWCAGGLVLFDFVSTAGGLFFFLFLVSYQS